MRFAPPADADTERVPRLGQQRPGVMARSVNTVAAAIIGIIATVGLSGCMVAGGSNAVTITWTADGSDQSRSLSVTDPLCSDTGARTLATKETIVGGLFGSGVFAIAITRATALWSEIKSIIETTQALKSTLDTIAGLGSDLGDFTSKLSVPTMQETSS